MKYLKKQLNTYNEVFLKPSSHHRHRQDQTVLSCLWCEQNWRQVQTVLGSPHPHSEAGQNTFEISVCRQSWLVTNSVHTADMVKTRQSCLVLSVWRRHYNTGHKRNTSVIHTCTSLSRYWLPRRLHQDSEQQTQSHFSTESTNDQQNSSFCHIIITDILSYPLLPPAINILTFIPAHP